MFSTRRRLSIGLTLVLMAGLLLAVPTAADAAIHEKIAAGCRAGGIEVEPPGQLKEGSMSFVRALRATGIIASIDESVPGQVTINFDLTKRSSKFMSAGFDLTIPDGAGPGVALILSPLPIPDPNFAAHANCRNLKP